MMNPKLLIVGGIGAAILIAIFIWAKVNFFEAGAYAVTKSVDVNAAYRLNVQGEDLRVYEYTTANWNCIFTAGTNKADQTCIWIGNSTPARTLPPTETQ